MNFCRANCKWLRPTEKEQGSNKPIHICYKYNRQVTHQGFHPKLVKLEECDQ